MMKKILLFILFVLIVCLIAGVFGIIHDQITYSIAPEYYTNFKFHQFGIGYYLSENNPRTGVFLIGLFATWWTGLIIGGIIGLIGINNFYYNKLFKIKYKSLIIVFLTTLMFSIIGFLIGVIKTNGIEDWPINYLSDGSDMSLDYLIIRTKDISNFIIVGMIHNFSYIGGLAGLFVGVLYNIKQGKSITK